MIRHRCNQGQGWQGGAKRLRLTGTVVTHSMERTKKSGCQATNDGSIEPISVSETVENGIVEEYNG